ncbi:aromatic compound dioxygenase [Lecanosticta acicola]|uniref:Aromatic compound dioxygenase n=1 Tax=Lecanosticta acicola TaxID=111012 RepID=A0AAI8YVZ8_9PEZI|nr:aromatic compound dioxygenase [Lecanosticta acicola]
MVSTKSLLTTACLLFSVAVDAHPHPPTNPNVLFARSENAKRCSDQVGAMKTKRHQMRKRQELEKRGLRPGIDDVDTTYVIHAEAPKYDFLKNDTCVLTPEVTQGPYWYPPRELLRQNIVEDQVGVPLELEIGIIDVNSCEPVDNVLISIWHCNSTGSYSAFAYDPNTPFETLLQGQGIYNTSGYDNFAFLANRQTTFLRGMWPTDEHGVTSFNSIFPGFYIERSIHIHVQVHTDWNITRNGTVGTSRVVETGQIFFAEELEREIMALEPYSSHTEIERTTNVGDGIFAQVVNSGAMANVDTEPLDGVDYKNGVLAYITLGIETTTIKNGTTASPIGITALNETDPDINPLDYKKH